jgi:hypothetical protein
LALRRTGRLVTGRDNVPAVRLAVFSTAAGRTRHCPPTPARAVAAADAAGLPAPTTPGTVLRTAAGAAITAVQVVGSAGTFLAAVLGRLCSLALTDSLARAAGGGAASLGPFGPEAVHRTGRAGTVPAGQGEAAALLPVAVEQLAAA